MRHWFGTARPRELVRRLRGRRDNSTLEDLEDAVQDVYLRALERSRRGEPPVAPRNAEAYLTRSVHNRLNSVQRARWREVRGHSDAQLENAQAYSETGLSSQPNDIHEAQERAALFAQLVAHIAQSGAPVDDERTAQVFARIQQRLAQELTDRHWVLLRMRVLQGVGVVQCAALLGISVGSVHNWTHRALAIVGECLRDFGVEPGELAYPDE